MIASTPGGRLRGERRGRILAFRGIPYARALEGAWRLREPQPVAPWSGVRDARRPGPAVPQPRGTSGLLRVFRGRGAPDSRSESLCVDIFTPGLSGRRPVLVWIHGGGFTWGTGGSFLYAGDTLARRGDVVVVTLNYRLGALGALDLASLGLETDIPANLGLRDQLAALTWVRSSIEAFGGDPERVTLAGQSAGAMSVGALFGAPAADGLFHRAILHSGAASNVHRPEEAATVARALLHELRLPDDDPKVQEQLEALPDGVLVAAQHRAARAIRLPLGSLAWQPSLDGSFLAHDPLERIAASDLPVVIGTTRDEWKLFTASDAKRRHLDTPTLAGYLERTLGSRALAERVQALYAKDEDSGAARSPGEVWEAFQTDRVFRVPASRVAERRHAPTWSYRFDWAPPYARRRIGACHSIDVPFLFGSLRHPGLLAAMGGWPGALPLSRRLQGAWLAFVRGEAPAADGLPDWPTYTPETRPSLALDTRPRLLEHPGEGARAFWEEVLGSG